MNSKDKTIRRLRKFIEVMFVAQKEKETVLFEENECLNQKVEKLNNENDILRKMICEYNDRFEEMKKFQEEADENEDVSKDDEKHSDKKKSTKKKTTFKLPEFHETLQNITSSSSVMNKISNLPREIEPLSKEFEKMENENKKLRKINKKLQKIIEMHESSLHNLRKQYVSLAERKAAEEAKLKAQIERLQKLTIETTNEIKWLSAGINQQDDDEKEEK